MDYDWGFDYVVFFPGYQIKSFDRGYHKVWYVFVPIRKMLLATKDLDLDLFVNVSVYFRRSNQIFSFTDS
jgi:hypothetical protein